MESWKTRPRLQRQAHRRSLPAEHSATCSVLDHRRRFLARYRRRRHRWRVCRRSFGEWRRLTLERSFQHMLDPAYRMDVETILDLIRNFSQVLDIFLGDQHALDASASRRE